MPSNMTAHAEKSALNGRPTNHHPQLQEMEAKGAAGSNDIDSSKPVLAIENDVMQLARLGEIALIQRLFESGKVDANYKDEQGVTPLHWAAIKNHYALCHFLIQSGADVNAPGGDLHATPVLWAARSCNYYVVNLLLQHGADPLRTDSQGFNLLQNATLDGNVYQVLLLLYHDIPVDTPDNSGHTSLMWAAYKGFPACVEALLRFGANVAATDDTGFTALHWALVKGSQECIQKLVEYGADRFAETSTGKTPAIVASEMNSRGQWTRALSNCGYDKDGNLKHFPISSTLIGNREVFLTRLFFLWPFCIVFVGIYILSSMAVYFGFPIALVTVGLMQYAANSNRFLQWMPANKRSLAYTPYITGVFAATLFWVGLVWLTKILPGTWASNILMNVLFFIFYALCTYFYVQSMTEDPGWIPKVDNRTEQQALVNELIENENFNERSFCTTCLLRRPLRSRHCRRCNRCVARQDHHCPWIYNCVAVNNHLHFFLYILNLECGIGLLVWLTVRYLQLLPPPEVTTCSVLADDLCAIYNRDPFTIVLVFWAILQLTWVTMLIFSQLIQIARARTTFESMPKHNHLSPTSATVTAAILSGSTATEDVGLAPRSMAPDARGARPAPRREGFFSSWKRLLGVDTFLVNASASRTPRHLYSNGILRNCQDFFLDEQPLFGPRPTGHAMLAGKKVDYTRLYDLSSSSIPRMEAQDEEVGFLRPDGSG